MVHKLLETDTVKCGKPILLSVWATFDGFRVFLQVVMLLGLPFSSEIALDSWLPYYRNY